MNLLFAELQQKRSSLAHTEACAGELGSFNLGLLDI
jgi:hypothetical protein